MLEQNDETDKFETTFTYNLIQHANICICMCCIQARQREREREENTIELLFGTLAH